MTMITVIIIIDTNGRRRSHSIRAPINHNPVERLSFSFILSKGPGESARRPLSYMEASVSLLLGPNHIIM